MPAKKAKAPKPITGGSATVTIPKPKGNFELSELKSKLWRHYQQINKKITDKQHQRSAEDEDEEHESLRRLLKPYANIYDYDYDVALAKKQFEKNTKDEGDKDEGDKDEYTSLIWAIKLSSKVISKKNIRDIELMCEYFLKKDENGKTDMNNSILNLNEKGGWNGSTALHKAAEYGRVDVTEFLMTKGADVNCTNEGNYTPLMLAARDGKHEVVLKIIDMSKIQGTVLQIEYNVADQGRFTDLALACDHEDSEDGDMNRNHGESRKLCVDYILNHIDDVRAKKVLMAANKFGKTPLLIACENGQKEIVRLIIDKMKVLFTKDELELEINRFSFRSKTALHLAIAFNPNLRNKHSKNTDMTIINMLLDNGAWSDRVEYGGNKDKANHPKYKWQKVYNYIQANTNKSDYEGDTEYKEGIRFGEEGTEGQSALSILCGYKFFMNEPRKIAIFQQLKSKADVSTFNTERDDDHNVGQLCAMYEPKIMYKYNKEENFQLLVKILDCIGDGSKDEQSKLILRKDKYGKNCLHKACAVGHIGVISVLIDRIIDSIQTKEREKQDREKPHCKDTFTKVLATRKFMDMDYLSEKDQNDKSCMDYLREYYKKSDHLRRDVEYLFEVALDGPEHKFYLLEMFPEILNAMPNPSIIMNDEMMESILKKLFYPQQYSSTKDAKDAPLFHYGKYADVALFDTLVNIAVALKHCAREKQMGRQILEKKVKTLSKMIVRCIESQSMEYTSNIADLLRYGLDLREVDANESAMTEETHDVSELRLALTLMSGPLRKCIDYDLLDVLGTAQISPYIERIFTINLKKGQIKPISDSNDLVQIRSHCLYYRYSPIIMFIFECWSKVFFFALVVIVSMYPSMYPIEYGSPQSSEYGSSQSSENGSSQSSENGSSWSYNYCEILLITYLFGGLWSNVIAFSSKVERSSEMRAREQFSMKLFFAVAIFLGVQWYSLSAAKIFTVVYALFVCLPDLINLSMRLFGCGNKNFKLLRYGSVCSMLSDSYNWAINFLRHSSHSVCSMLSDSYNWAINFFRHSFQDPWSLLESISLMLILIWFLNREFSLKGPIVTMLQDNIGVAVESLTSLITFGYVILNGAIIPVYSCFTSMLTFIGGVRMAAESLPIVTMLQKNIGVAVESLTSLAVELFTSLIIFGYVILNGAIIPMYSCFTSMLTFIGGTIRSVPLFESFESLILTLSSIITNFTSHVSAVTPVKWERFILSFTKMPLAFNMLRSMLYVETFGSLTMSLFEMMKDVSVFLVVFLIPLIGFVFAAFSSVGYFPNCHEPESQVCDLPEEILNFRKVLGIILPSDDGKEVSDKVEAAVVTIIALIFQVVIFVVLTNLLIARMTKSYEKIELSAFNKWIASKAKITIDLLLVQEREPARMLPPPLNIITIMMSIVKEFLGIVRETSCEIIDALEKHMGINNRIWNVVSEICGTKYWFPSYVDSSGNPTYFSMTSLVADVVVCLISLPFTPFYEISLLSGEITRAAIPSSTKKMWHVIIVVCYPLFYSIYIGVIIKELILRLRTGVTRLVSSKDTNTKLSKNKEVFWGTLQTANESSEDRGGNICATIDSMYRGWYKSLGLVSFITSIMGNGINMCTLIEFLFFPKSGRDQPLFSQLLQLFSHWIKIHLVAIGIEFVIVLFARYDYVYIDSYKAAANSTKVALLEPADAYQPGTSDLEKIKKFDNGSVVINIVRVVVTDPMPLHGGLELSQEIRPYVVVYFGSKGADPKNNQNRRKTKTHPAQKNMDGVFQVEPFEELWFKNIEEEPSDSKLKFVVWNRHIGDSNESGKDAEPLYYAETEGDVFQKKWIANGLYLGRVPLVRHRASTKQKLADSYIQIILKVKYDDEKNLYGANIRAASNAQKARLNRRSTSSVSSQDSPRANSIAATASDGTNSIAAIASDGTNSIAATASDGTNSIAATASDGTKLYHCHYLEGYRNEKNMFTGCNILMKKTETVNGAVDEYAKGTIGEYDEDKWGVSWDDKRNHDVTGLPTHITRDDLLKDDKSTYKIYKNNRRNKDVRDTYQFFRKAERDDIYNRRNEKDNEKNNDLDQD